MRNGHVIHLLGRYVHGQLRPAQQARVMNHVRTCAACRSALAREERLVADLRREMPAIGQPRQAQLAGVWAGVWQEIATPRTPRRSNGSVLLPGLGAVLALVMVLAVALPLLAQDGVRAEAAPLQPRPISTSSPTPGATDTSVVARFEDSVAAPAAEYTVPRATVAFVSVAGASPAPMPEATVSPVAGVGRR